MFSNDRSKFEITDEQMFWETGPDSPAVDCATASTTSADTSAAPPRPDAAVSSSTASNGTPTTAPAGLSSPAWALEPDWARTSVPSRDGRPWPRLLIPCGAAGAALVIALSVAMLASGATGRAKPVHVASASKIQSKAVVLASYSPRETVSSVPVRPAGTGRSVVRRSHGHPKPAMKPRTTTSPARATPVPAEPAGMTQDTPTAPAQAPDSEQVLAPVDEAMSEPAAVASPAPRASSPPQPASTTSPFSFER